MQGKTEKCKENWSTERKCPRCHSFSSKNNLDFVCPICRNAQERMNLPHFCKKATVTIARVQYNYCILYVECRLCEARFFARLRAHQECNRCGTEWDCMPKTYETSQVCGNESRCFIGIVPAESPVQPFERRKTTEEVYAAFMEGQCTAQTAKSKC